MTPASGDLALALDLADVADRLTMAVFTGEPLAHVAKGDGSPVTATDRHVEEALRGLLHERRPDDAVLGEEGGRSGPAEADRCWILDPIDGTASFVAGGRGWATQVALEAPDGLVVGVTSAPAASARWWGSAGGGAASRRGRRAPEERVLTVSGGGSLRSARVVVHVEPGPLAELGEVLVAAAAEGSSVPPAAHGALMVAAGEVDVCLVTNGAAWDHAAFGAIVAAAGGRWSTLDGTSSVQHRSGYFPALFSNGRVHDEALAALAAPNAGPEGSIISGRRLERPT